MRLDLRGADFSNCDLQESWFTESNLEGVPFRAADLHRAHLDGVDIRRADFSEAWLRRVEFFGSTAVGASFAGADLIRAEFFRVDARNADFRRAVLRDAGMSRSDLRGANLAGTSCRDTSMLEVLMDDSTVVHEMTGSLYGPILWFTADGEAMNLNGEQLSRWLSARGAEVEVLRSQLPGGPATA